MNYCHLSIAALVVSLVLLAGCDHGESIRQYTVKRTPRAATSAAAKSAPVEARMLGAIVPRETEAWFFKMTGARDAVAAQREAFDALVKSVQFGADGKGDPTWKLPPDWQQRPGDSIRFATLVVSVGDNSLECTVTKLGREGPLDDYVLNNINRWRGQLGVQPIQSADVARESRQLETMGKQSATIVEIVGMSSGGGMGAAPFAGGRLSPPVSTSPAESNEPSTLTYQTPAGWKPGQLESDRGGISVRREAAFEVADGERKLEITITKMSAAPAMRMANVNRWRGQVGLSEISSEQLERERKTLEFVGGSADYVQFVGAEQTILGVIAERAGTGWYVKLQGSADLALREQANFEAFVKSVQFE